MCYSDTFRTLFTLEIALSSVAEETGEHGMEVFALRWNKTLEYHFPCVPSCQQWMRLVSFCARVSIDFVLLPAAASEASCRQYNTKKKTPCCL